MRLSSLFGPTAAEFASITRFWPVLIHLASLSQAVNFTPVPSPNLDLSQLGRVALTGNFDAISLYHYEQQNENPFSTNGSQSLLSQMPNGAFATLVSADAYIMTMCPFVLQDGTLAGVVVGGNFTSLGGVEAQGVALVDPSTAKITPLPGLSGQVFTLFCDQNTSTVYVGGDFTGANSSNAIAWVGMAGWTNLPFAGFNGPVNSIAQAPNGNVIFGGSFSGLGNTTLPTQQDQQIINLSSANLSSSSSTSTNGFSDPSNIICRGNGQGGTGNTWLLSDNTPGFWRADMNFGYEPTKLRVWNTHQDGRGTKTFRYTAFPINGIMNFTYTDPDTKELAACDARCPLSSDLSVQYQDFHFVNVIGMSGFQIDISDWYGSGGGLDGVELFENDIFAYAVDGLNEPACANIQYGSNATTTGPWTVTPSGQSISEYLTANLTGPIINSGSASVVFKPDIKQPGNYTVKVYTPGCQQDSSCASRGIVNITGVFSSGTSASAPVQTQIYQTNDFDKYDQIYYGYVDSNSDTFRPSVTITPISGQNSNISLVAQRVGFTLLNSTGGLNGIFEFNPNQATINTDYSNSTYDVAGTKLETNALINSLTVLGGNMYVAGNFSAAGFENIFSISSGNATALPNGGLNADVSTVFAYGDVLYIGGNFSNTTNPGVTGLSNVAAFDTSKGAWQSLGAGVNGRVNTIVPLLLNVTSGQPETCITVNGDFDQILASDSSQASHVQGLAVWVPSHNDWLQNLNVQTTAITGKLSAATNISGSSPLLAGTISSQGMGIGDAVELSTSGNLGLKSLGVRIQPQQISSNMRKRAVNGQNATGAVTGLFYNNGGRNITILGGHFTATASNGSVIDNLVFINATGSGGETVTGVGNGLDDDSVFLALATQADTLYAGGTISGKVNGAAIDGLIFYDLAQANFASPQPPPFSGNNVAVNAIAIRPSTTEVYVGGNFDSAGSLGCPSVCTYQNSQWNRPSSGISGSVSALTWQGNDQLLVGGNLTIGGNATSLANYDAKKFVWSVFSRASTAVPGPVTALTPANSDVSKFWVSGQSTNGSAFLMKFDGSNFQSVGDVFGADTIIEGLSILSLSQDHSDNPLVDAGTTLLVTGQLNLPSFGNVSALLFNGTTFSPFILSNSGNSPGSLSQLFSEKQFTFSSSGGHLALGFVILIALACALGATFLLVVAGIFIERYRRRLEGYHPAPTTYFDKTSNMGRIPPERLFGSLGRGARGPTGTPML